MKAFFQRLIQKSSEDFILTQSAALALYTAFSLAPLVILIISFLSTLNLGLQTQLVEQVRNLVGADAAGILTTIIDKAEERQDLNTFAGWVGVATLLLSASAIFGQLQSALNLVFDSPTNETSSNASSNTWWKSIHQLVVHRLISFGMVLTFIFISFVSLVVSSALSMLALGELSWIGAIVTNLANLATFSVLFGAIFKWMPDQKISVRAAFRGGVITAFLFVIGKFVIGVYLGQAAVGSAYGAAGSFIVLLIWVYYSSLIVFIGAEIAAMLVEKNSTSKKTIKRGSYDSLPKIASI